MDINNPIPQKWTEYVTQTNNGLEVVPSVLYSVKAYTSAVTTILTFFDVVEGSRPDLTNMKSANTLAFPESFLIQNIRVFNWAQPSSNDSGAGANTAIVSQFADWVNLTRRGLLSLKISNKQYGPWPLWMLSANSFVKGGFATGSDLLADYGQIDGNLYPLVPNLVLSPIQPFTVTLTWPGAAGDAIPGGPVTLSTGAESTLPIQVLFDGQLARAIS
jgi:hypothetical protein